MVGNKDWIEWKWTPEKPYPETLDTEVHTKCWGMTSVVSDIVKNWYWEPKHGITHYRIASEEN